jgi:hypothetical protein
MKRLAAALLCACMIGSIAAAGGKSGAKAKSGPLLSAAPASPSPSSRRGGGSAVLGAGFVAGRAADLDARNVPPLDPERGVSEQDCTKAVDLTRGNLKCK